MTGGDTFLQDYWPAFRLAPCTCNTRALFGFARRRPFVATPVPPPADNSLSVRTARILDTRREVHVSKRPVLGPFAGPSPASREQSRYRHFDIDDPSSRVVQTGVRMHIEAVERPLARPRPAPAPAPARHGGGLCIPCRTPLLRPVLYLLLTSALQASVCLSPHTYMDFSSSPTPPTVSAAALDAHVMPPRRIPTRILARYVRACLDVYLRPICYVAFRLRVRGVSRLQTSASDRTGLYCAAALAAHRRGISTRSPALTARTRLSPSAHSVSGHRRSRRRLCTSCRRGAILRIKFSPLSSLNLGTLVSSLQYRYAATLGSSKNSDLWASNRHPTRAWHSAPRWERPARECQIPRYTSPLRGWVNQNVLILAGTGTYNPPEPIISSRSTSYTVTIQSSISSLWPSLSTGA
ncbi:hypothetical protein C8J57DRAFT_1523411 [Mycena rebaudengoi]|nr:hypothetical protein C8J57DRAFT_1523411 [Mycena rebaudengoi]